MGRRAKGEKGEKGEKDDKWKDLPEGFQERFAGADDLEIDQEVKAIAMKRIAVLEAKELDEDLKAKRAAATDAGEVYRESEKQAKLQTAFLRDLLKSRGRSLPGD